MERITFRLIAFLLAGYISAAAFGQSISLTEAQVAKLRSIVESNAEAGKLFETIRRTADKALTSEPDPIALIQQEGKLKSDPLRVRTDQSLRDMPKLQSLGYAYAVSGKDEYAAKAREFILAWAKQNHSAGDPIDDTALEPLFVTYDLTRSRFPEAERTAADTYLREIASKELTVKQNHISPYNNWNSHRLKIVGMIGFVLSDKSIIGHVVLAYKEHVDHNLNVDGSSFDFHQRDALFYHIYDLEGLLSLAIAARNNGIDLYSYLSPNGGSLEKGIAFLLPYAEGKLTHGEFTHSKVAFDRQRAESGDKHYAAGTPFDPTSALGVLALGELFDPKLLGLETKLVRAYAEKSPTWQALLNPAEPDAEKFPTWQAVLNAARR